jgi:hypothetical protein
VNEVAANETVEIIRQEDGAANAICADVTSHDDIRRMVKACTRSIFANCIADFYDARRIVFWRLAPFCGYQIACPVCQIRCPAIAPTVSLVGSC